jgi:hypothetical protein
MTILTPRENRGCALYIGCGTDFEPVSDLCNEVYKFIYIDSQPLTRHGDLYQAFSPQEKLELGHSKTYMKTFLTEAERAGFKKISLDGVYPHTYKNFSTNQEIYHYFSLCFPIQSFKQNPIANKEELLRLVFLLNQVTHMVVRRYVPNVNIFRYFLRPIVFIGYDDTVYFEKLSNILPYERNKITALLQMGQYRDRFSNYTFIQTALPDRDKVYFPSYELFADHK